MRVGLDLTPTIAGNTGVARYARELHAALVAAEGVTVAGIAIGQGPHAAPTGTRRLPVPLRIVRASWRRFGLPRFEWLSGPVDLVHALDGEVPPSKLPVVITVHDTVALDLPELHHPRLVDQQRAQLATAARAAVVVVDTEATARSLARHGLAGVPVVVVHLGRTPLPAAAPTNRVTDGIDGPVVLIVGELTPRKDHALLLEALSHPSLLGATLVAVGPGDAEPLAAQARRLGVDGRVRFAGTVDDATLAGLYRRATVLCLPSRAEGFGLPVVEAMAAGLPIVTTDEPALAEVGGGATRLVPIGDRDALAAALVEVVEDGDLRARMAEAGRRRAAEFDWRETARRTIEAYRTAMACA